MCVCVCVCACACMRVRVCEFANMHVLESRDITKVLYLSLL